MIKGLRQYADKRIILILIGTYVAYRTVHILTLIFAKIYLPEREFLTWELIFLDTYVYHLLYITPFIPFIAILTKYLMSKSDKKILVFGIHFLLAFLFKPIIFLIPTTIRAFYAKGYIELNDYREYSNALTVYADANFIMYLSLVAITYTYYTFDKIRAIETKQSNLKKELSEAKLQSLKSHLQPHFLFNTLNSILTLIDHDKEKSKEMIVDLSDVLREILIKNRNNKIELQEELLITNKYLNILKIRFENQLTFHQEVEPGLELALVPTLSIQQIIENAIKHGYSQDHKELSINLKIRKNKKMLNIEITNNGLPLSQDFAALLKEGHGLSNLNERLKVIYQGKANFQLYNEDEKKEVTCLLQFPFELSVSTLH